MKQLKLIILLFGLIMLSSSVLGFGVTDWLTGPISVAPGNTKEVIFELQNMLGNEDITVNTQINEGGDIVTIKEGDKIEVPFGVKKEIHLNVNIPKDYPEGDYPVSIRFITIPTKSSNSPVQMGTGITKSFGVSVNSGIPEEKPKEETLKGSNIGVIGILLMVAILIVILIIVKFIHKKK